MYDLVAFLVASQRQQKGKGKPRESICSWISFGLDTKPGGKSPQQPSRINQRNSDQKANWGETWNRMQTEKENLMDIHDHSEGKRKPEMHSGCEGKHQCIMDLCLYTVVLKLFLRAPLVHGKLVCVCVFLNRQSLMAKEHP